MGVCLGYRGIYLILFLCWISEITVRTSAVCPDGSDHQFGDDCYVQLPDSSSWDDSQERCRQEGGTLPVVSDDATQEFLVGLMKKLQVNSIWLDGRETIKDWFWMNDGSTISHQGCYTDFVPWVEDLKFTTTISDMVPSKCMDVCRSQGRSYAGIKSKIECYCGDSYGVTGQLAGPTGPWCSVTCPGNATLYCGGWNEKSVYNVNGGYSAWGYRQPDGSDTTCAVLDKSGNDRKFADEHCYQKLNYICDIPMTLCDSSDKDYYINDDTDTCLYIGGQPLSWWKAHNSCRQKQGNLITIDNISVHELVKNAVINLGSDKKVWIGLTRSNWRWTSSGSTFEYTDWAERSPADTESNCLLLTETTGFKWSDTNCNGNYPTICTIPAMTTVSQTTDTTGVSTTANPTEEAESLGGTTTGVTTLGHTTFGGTTIGIITNGGPTLSDTTLVGTTSGITTSSGTTHSDTILGGTTSGISTSDGTTLRDTTLGGTTSGISTSDSTTFSETTLGSTPVGVTTDLGTTASNETLGGTTLDGTTADTTTVSDGKTDVGTNKYSTRFSPTTERQTETDETFSEAAPATTVIAFSSSTTNVANENFNLSSASSLKTSTVTMKLSSTDVSTAERDTMAENNITYEYEGTSPSSTESMETRITGVENTTILPSSTKGIFTEAASVDDATDLVENLTKTTTESSFMNKTAIRNTTSEYPTIQNTFSTTTLENDVTSSNLSIQDITTETITGTIEAKFNITSTELFMGTTKVQSTQDTFLSITNNTTAALVSTYTNTEPNVTLSEDFTTAFPHDNGNITTELFPVPHSINSTNTDNETVREATIASTTIAPDSEQSGLPSLFPTVNNGRDNDSKILESYTSTTPSMFNQTSTITKTEGTITVSVELDNISPTSNLNNTSAPVATMTPTVVNFTESVVNSTDYIYEPTPFPKNESAIFRNSAQDSTISYVTNMYSYENQTSNTTYAMGGNSGEATSDTTTDSSMNTTSRNVQSNIYSTSASSSSENASVAERVTHASLKVTSPDAPKNSTSKENGTFPTISTESEQIDAKGKTITRTPGNTSEQQAPTLADRGQPATAPTVVLLSTILYRSEGTDGGKEEDYTRSTSENSTIFGDGNGTGIPGDGQTIQNEGSGGWSLFKIVVVAGLVVLALGLATTMVVFLSCKKRSGRRKSNENASCQTPPLNPPLGGATRVDIFSSNGFGHQNNGFTPEHEARHGDKKKRKKGDKYKAPYNPESKDISTMEDIRVHRSPNDKDGNKKQKKNREGSLRGGNPVPEWNTLPRYYYAMGKDSAKDLSADSRDRSDDHLNDYMHQPFPLRQEVFFKMSQVFGEQSLPNGQNTSDNRKPVADSDNRAPKIYFVGDKRLYENASQYGNMTNMQSFSLPRENGHAVNGTDNKRLYEQAPIPKKGPANYYERKKASMGGPGQKSGPQKRAHSFSSHYAIGNTNFSSRPDGDNHRRNASIQRTSSDSFTLVHKNPHRRDNSNSPVSDANRSTILRNSRPGSLRQRISPADLIIPVPPTVPNGTSNHGKKPPPPKPPRERSPIDKQRDNSKPRARLKPFVVHNGEGTSNGTNGTFVLNAEEGITWC